MHFKIFTTADLHLGKKSSSIPSSLVESSSSFTWHRLVEWSIDNEADAVVLAGDIIDRDNRFFEAIGPIQQGFRRLKEAEIPVVMVAGNHDFDVLPDIIQSGEFDNVHLLGEKGTWEVKIIETGNGPVQFLGWSFPSQYIREDPLLQLTESKPDLNPNLPTIGVLHGDITDSKSKYAPLGMNNLIIDPVHVWVLGHVHIPGKYRNADPLVLYPGSPHSLNSKETGAHGPSLLTIEGRDYVTAEQIPLSPVRYEKLEVDITDVADESEFRTLITGQLIEDVESKAEELEQVSRIIYDVEVTGKHSSVTDVEGWFDFVEEFEQEVLSETVASIRTIENRTEPKVENLEELAKQPTPPGLLAKAILDIQSGEPSDFLDELYSQFKNKLDAANASMTYQPLRKEEEIYSDTGEAYKEFVQRECHKMLGTLLSQQEEV